MTDLLYMTDSYLRSMTATVTAHTDDGVVLDRTVYFYGAGGQPADQGTLTIEDNTVYRVVGMKKRGDDVVHLLEDDDRPSVGSIVTGELDWERRYALMRTHTALHILCGVIWRDYQAHVTGGQMEPLQGRLDFEFARMDKSLIQV